MIHRRPFESRTQEVVMQSKMHRSLVLRAAVVQRHNAMDVHCSDKTDTAFRTLPVGQHRQGRSYPVETSDEMIHIEDPFE